MAFQFHLIKNMILVKRGTDMRNEAMDKAETAIFEKIAESGEVTDAQLAFLSMTNVRNRTGILDSIKIDKKDITELGRFILNFLTTKGD